MNTLRRISSWTLLVLALGTSLAMAQEAQPVPKTKAPAANPSSPVAAGVAQADESPWAKLCTKNEQAGNKQICIIQHGGLDAETGIVLGTAAVRGVEWPDRYFVPGEVRGYCTIGAPSRVGGDGAMVSGAGGL